MDVLLTLGPWAADLEVAGDDLSTDEGLETAVIVSLFTDRRASKDDELPAGETDRRGWWGDGLAAEEGDRTGSLLWLLHREKQLARVAAKAEAYARDSLQWLLDDAVAESVTVTGSIPRSGWLDLAVAIKRPGEYQAASYKYHYNWQAQEVRRP